MIQIKQITEATQQDIRLKNQPFKIWGKMIPTYINETWDHSIERLPADQIREMCFPDEQYDYQQMQSNTVFFGAYDQDACIGLAVVQKGFFNYDYVYDLKVDQAYRKQGIAQMLIEEAAIWAKSHGKQGLYTIGQDNNVSACLFYLKAGFRIGGLDTEVYRGTAQEDKKDILFYLDDK
ncbi:GNAT family N-acetyltransferase [Enterococcus sp. RIT-PI-f]|uniref:GNAT family N-acetyltransferase n=1 Tax=Enterococcus sp. RIT-PI-f TaxID=1690244 RepID=UPI0006B9B593|nr:GNAT family N-acetyltransferase [Enterococcus sp. RIT-PI-f]KPG70198.1 streptothricin acetyltransferase [Enterococcus sp. RIT-PI-f]